MTGPHEPTDTYRSFLEWQIRTELRRCSRFEPPPPALARRLVSVAALIVVSVLIGAGGTVAADRLGESRQKAILVEQAQLRLQMAEAQARLLEDLYREREIAGEVGRVTTREVAEARERWQEARARAELARIDLEEVQSTGERPRDDLAAPLDGEHDRVRERLEVRVSRAAARLEAVQAVRARAQALYEAGVVSSSEILETAQRVTEAELELRLLREQLELRRRYLAGELTEIQVEELELRSRATTERERLQAHLESLQARETRARQLHQAGVISSAELGEVRLSIQEVELQLRLTELELETLSDR